MKAAAPQPARAAGAEREFADTLRELQAELDGALARQAQQQAADIEEQVKRRVAALREQAARELRDSWAERYDLYCRAIERERVLREDLLRLQQQATQTAVADAQRNDALQSEMRGLRAQLARLQGEAALREREADARTRQAADQVAAERAQHEREAAERQARHESEAAEWHAQLIEAHRQQQALRQDLERVEAAHAALAAEGERRQAAYAAELARLRAEHAQLAAERGRLEARCISLERERIAQLQQLAQLQESHDTQSRRMQQELRVERERAARQLQARRDELDALAAQFADAERAAQRQLSEQAQVAARRESAMRAQADSQLRAAALREADLRSELRRGEEMMRIHERALVAARERHERLLHDLARAEQVGAHRAQELAAARTALESALQERARMESSLRWRIFGRWFTPKPSDDVVDLQLAFQGAGSGARPAGGADLAALLDHEGADFVEAAYRAILGRSADPEGRKLYVDRLRRGVSKMRVLAQLALSVEAQDRVLSIDGLQGAIRRERKARQPLWGWFYRRPERPVRASAAPAAPARPAQPPLQHELAALETRLAARQHELAAQVELANAQAQALLRSAQEALYAARAQNEATETKSAAAALPYDTTEDAAAASGEAARGAAAPALSPSAIERVHVLLGAGRGTR